MKNIFLLLGTIIGAGIFSLPIAYKNIGFWLFAGILVLVSFFMAKINYFYRMVVESQKERHQLTGYVKLILGPNWARLATFLIVFSTFSTLLAYLILSGQFLTQITPLTATQGSWLFYLVVFLLLAFAGRSLEVFDVFLTIIKVTLFLIIILIVFRFTSFFEIISFTSNSFAPKDTLIAYGAILFALSGHSIIPELKRESGVKQSINLAQGIVTLVYLCFAFTISRFVQGQAFVFSQPLVQGLFNLAGVFSVMTPYLMLSWVAYDLFDKDLGFTKKHALTLTLVIPILLFILGVHNFMSVISITGAVFFGSIGLLILEMYHKQFPGKNVFLVRLIQIIFALGAIAEVIAVF